MTEVDIIKKLEKLERNKKVSNILSSLLDFQNLLTNEELDFIKNELEGYNFPEKFTFNQITKNLPHYRVRKGFLRYSPNAMQSHLTGELKISSSGAPLEKVGIKESIELLEKRKKGYAATYSDPNLSNIAVTVSQSEIDNIIRIVRIKSKKIISSLKLRSKHPKTKTNLIVVSLIVLIALSAISYYIFFPRPDGDCQYSITNGKNYTEFRTINNGDKDFNVEYSVSTLWESSLGECFMDNRTYNGCNVNHKSQNSFIIKCQELPLKQSMIITCIGNLQEGQEVAVRYNSDYTYVQYNCKLQNLTLIRKVIQTNPKYHKIFKPILEKITLKDTLSKNIKSLP